MVKVKFKLLNMTRLLTENQVSGHSSSKTIKRSNRRKSLDEILRMKQKLEDNSCNNVGSDINNLEDVSRNLDFKLEETMERKPFTSLENSALWEEYYKRMKEISQQVENKHGWANFDRVFMTSALSGHGVRDLRVSTNKSLLLK